MFNLDLPMDSFEEVSKTLHKDTKNRSAEFDGQNTFQQTSVVHKEVMPLRPENPAEKQPAQKETSQGLPFEIPDFGAEQKPKPVPGFEMEFLPAENAKVKTPEKNHDFPDFSMDAKKPESMPIDFGAP